MNTITLHMENHADNTVVSNYFIDTLMPQANGEFVKIYLYLLRCVSASRISLSVSEMADLFNQTEADILRGLRYWDKMNALRLNFSPDGMLTGISFTDLSAANASLAGNGSAVNGAVSGSGSAMTANPVTGSTMRSNAASMAGFQDETPALRPAAPSAMQAPTLSETAAAKEVSGPESYSMTRVNEFKQNDENFAMLIFAVTEYMGEALSPSAVQRIAYFYDTLKFPTDLIEYLVGYCVQKGHKSIRYIEKIAVSWAEAGITSVKQAKLETANHNTTIYSVMNAFGIGSRDPGQREREFITKWTDTYCFDADMIIEACNRTLKATHQPSFEYADSILTKWNKANVKTPEDIRKSDAEYELLRNQKKASNAASAPGTNNNRFHNFHQRDTDIDSLESALISNNS